MHKSNVTDSCTKRLINARKSVNRIRRIRRNKIVNLLIFGICLGISYLLMIFVITGGFAEFLALSAERRHPIDLFALVTAMIVFFAYHGILLIMQFSAEKQQEQAEIDQKCEDTAADISEELNAIFMRYLKSYCDTVFRHAQQSYAITRTMAILGSVILLTGIILSFFNLTDPTWMPFMCAVILDLMIFLYKFYYSDSMKKAQEVQVYASNLLNAQLVNTIAAKQLSNEERMELIKIAAESMVDRSSSGRDSKKEKNEKQENTEELPYLRLIIPKNKSE